MSVRLLSNRLEVRFATFAIAAIFLNACSSGGGDSSSPSTMAVTGTLTQQSASSVGDPVSAFEASFATTATSLSLDCGAAGTFAATVDPTTGSFSATGVPLGVPCSFNFIGTKTGATKCRVAFQDTSSYDLNNNAMSTGTATATAGVALGSITCDTNGNVTIPSANVANVSSGASVAAATAFDFTGVWTASPYTGTLPTGYATAANCTGNNCNGVSIGQIISLVRFHGQKFTPSAGQCTPAINVTCPSTSGTTDKTKDGYAMSIWGGDYAHGIGACGAKTGFTSDEARAYAHLDLDTTAPALSGNNLTYGHYVWSTPSGFGTDVGWTKPWMYGGATAGFTMQDCQPVSIPSTVGGTANRAGYACYSQVNNSSNVGIGTYVWNVNFANAGGCVDSSNNPLMINNWSNLIGSCSNAASAFNSNMNTSTCTYTGAPVVGQPSITFTCSFSGGSFRDISGATGAGNDNGPDFSNPYTMPNGDFSGQPSTIIASGAACAGGGGHDEATLITAATGVASAAQAAASKELLMRYQCYANAYWQHTSNGSGSTSCARNYNFDWSTNSYATFVLGDDRSMKPQNAFITDRVFYSNDGQWAFLKNEDTKFQSIPTPTGSTLCPMKNITELKFQHISATKILVNLTQQTVMADKSANCQGAVQAAVAGGGNLSPDPQGLNNLYQQLQAQRLLFYLSK